MNPLLPDFPAFIKEHWEEISSQFTPNQRIVFENRFRIYGERKTMQIISYELGMSRQRVEQIEKQAVTKVFRLIFGLQEDEYPDKVEEPLPKSWKMPYLLIYGGHRKFVFRIEDKEGLFYHGDGKIKICTICNGRKRQLVPVPDKYLEEKI